MYDVDVFFFFFKQKTAYEMRISDWSSDVCSSDLTKALQRQLDRETERIYSDPATLRRKVVVRKGRENYLCLLNLEDALQGGFAGRAATLAHLVARWAAFTKDGDMVGGDLPGWLPTLFRRKDRKSTRLNSSH